MRREEKKTGTRLKEAFWHREKNVAFYLHRLHSDIFQALSPLSIFFPSGFFCLSPLFSREQQLCGSISFPSFFVLLLLFCVSPLFYPNRRLRCHVVYNECKKRNNFIASLLPMISLSFAFRG